MEIQLEKFLKKFNFFISTTFLPDQSNILEYLNEFKMYKITNIELGSNHCFNSEVLNHDFQNFKILIHNYFPPAKKNIIINIASIDEKIRNQSIEHIKKCILFSKKNNAELYTFHPGFKLDPVSQNLDKKNYDFIWENKSIRNDYAQKYFFSSLDEIIGYAKNIDQRIALETEGSFNHFDKLLFQNIEDILNFTKNYHPEDIKINLNIGHLNLAKEVFNFDIYEFYNLIDHYIAAFELSHNYGINDDHLPLIEEAWYWDIIKQKKFKDIPKVLEYRNLTFNELVTSIKLVKNIYEK